MKSSLFSVWYSAFQLGRQQHVLVAQL